MASTKNLSDASGEDHVDPWNVTSGSEKGIDYNKLIDNFGCSKIDDDLLIRFEKVTKKKPHHLLKRGVFFSHRDLDKILNLHEAEEPFYLYTGRGPSSTSLHLGHLVPLMFTQWLQEVFDVPVVIQLTDDEKFLWKDISMEEAKRFAEENIKDIIALGFDPNNTFIFSDLEYFGQCSDFCENILQIQECVTFNQAKGIFGFKKECPSGKIGFPAVQSAPSFSSSFPHIFEDMKNVPCLIPCAIDQDPYFRMTRDVAPKLGFIKPALIHSTFIPALQGVHSKMSASDAKSTIFLTDSPEDIALKINTYVFPGSRTAVEGGKSPAADCGVDIAFQYLTFFLEDDKKLEEMRESYTSGTMSKCELEEILIGLITEIVIKHKISRGDLTPNFINKFTSLEALKFTLKYRKIRDTSSEEKELQVQKTKKAPSKVLHSKLSAPAEEDLITPWNVQSASEKGFDYQQISEKFGVSEIGPALIERFKDVIKGKELHHFLKRGLFFSHRDLDKILTFAEEGKPFYLFTSFRPSYPTFHLGHLIQLKFTKWLQKVFKVPLVIQLSDDESFLWEGLEMEAAKKRAKENAKSIIALGFDMKRTFILQNLEFFGTTPAFHQNMVRIQKLLLVEELVKELKLTNSDAIGKFAFPATRSAPAFSSSFICKDPRDSIFENEKNIPCLIISGIDQDPLIRMTREVAPRLGYIKPAVIYSTFLPSLQGVQNKMSASDVQSCIFLDYPKKTVKNKINRAFSGGQPNAELHKKHGGDCDVDIAYQYLKPFCKNDAELEKIRDDYTSGVLLAGDMKIASIQKVNDGLIKYQTKIKSVSDDEVDQWETSRRLNFEEQYDD